MRIDVAEGSKREKLKLSKSSPLHPTERTEVGRVATSLMGQMRTSLLRCVQRQIAPTGLGLTKLLLGTGIPSVFQDPFGEAVDG